MNCINIIEKVEIKYKVAFLILNLFQAFILSFHISTESAPSPRFIFLDFKQGYPCRQTVIAGDILHSKGSRSPCLGLYTAWYILFFEGFVINHQNEGDKTKCYAAITQSLLQSVSSASHIIPV